MGNTQSFILVRSAHTKPQTPSPPSTGNQPTTSSPHKATQDGHSRHSCKEPTLDEIRQTHLVEMKGLFVGPVPVDRYQEKFVGKCQGTPPALNMSAVPSGPGVEHNMYAPFCNELNLKKVCPGYVLCDVSSLRSANTLEGRVQAPDVMLLPEELVVDGKLPERLWPHCEIYVEFKPEHTQDAFTNAKGKPLENPTKEGSKTRGQLTDYGAAMMSCQQRCFIYIIEICGRRVRFLRWDRSGCTVSEDFDLHTESHKLSAFLHQYSTLSREQRGHDPTARPATTAEKQALKDAIEEYQAEAKANNINASFVEKTLNKDYAPYVVTIDRGGKDKKDQYELIIGKPFFEARSACGRATRVYAAYSPSLKLVFLKDSWRHDSEGVQTEQEIYDALEKAGIPHLATNFFVGDVEHLPEGLHLQDDVDKGDYYLKQNTVTDKFAAEEPDMSCEPGLRALVHCRVVQKLGFPLQNARNSKEIVAAIRNAVQCVYEAAERTKILHRDVSSGNILIDKDNGGFLNDWDHGRHADLQSVQVFRTGTWQFISIALLRNPEKLHTIQDDLESAFWVLLYVSLHYIKLKEIPDTFAPTFFDEVYTKANRYGHVQGGSHKKDFINEDLEKLDLHWDCEPLDKLIHDLAEFFASYYAILTSLAKGSERVKKAAADDLRFWEADIGPNRLMLKLLDEALDQDGWPEHDVVADQFPRSESQQRNKRKAEGENTLGTSTTSNIPSVSFSIPDGVTSTGGRSNKEVGGRPTKRARQDNSGKSTTG